MQIVNSLGRYQLVPLYFAQDAIAASQTSTALNPIAAHGVVLDNIGVVMPWAGEIVAISANLSAASTNGTLAVVPTIDTVAKTDPALAITTDTAKSDTARRGTTVFAKDAVLGVQITTSAAWTAETMDLMVILWVTQKITGI